MPAKVAFIHETTKQKGQNLAYLAFTTENQWFTG